ncbi:AAA family ATPase [Mammaliicoccus lentus]|uniref:AAA family ATPase n=1 Tax=Mammaliicoccus lentus TaxID=42858 RepID=UPI003F579934
MLLSEDDWLSQLYPNEITTFDDYLKYSKLIKPLLKEHIQRILKVGSNVVLDFPGNTKAQRSWLLSIATEIKANHELIFLNIDDEKCLERIKKRSIEEPSRKNFDTKETFEYVSSFFEEPLLSEGLNINEIKGSGT